jgi:hypothetical protein
MGLAFSRSQPNWIDDVLINCSHVETPRSWLWWSLVTAISAVSANYSLRILKGAVLYRPNLYVMLLGESGLGKGFGVNLSKLLVQKSDCTRVIAGRSSIQAVVSELAKSKSRPDGKQPIADSRGFVVNGELSSAIIADVDALSILTDLYDGHYNPEWDNLLKISGKEKLKRPYLVTLFGSSPDHFYDSIPVANIGGGYVARNLIVYEESRYQNVDLLNVDDEGEHVDLINSFLVPEYAPFLTKIGEGSGVMRYTRDAADTFNDWRRKWRETQQKERTGFFNRIPDHVLKTAMCLCLSRYESHETSMSYENNLVITEEEIIISIAQVVNLVYSNQMVGSGSTNKSDMTASHSKIVLDLLLKAQDQKLSRKILMSRAYPFGIVDIQSIDKVLDALIEMNWVKRERIGVGSHSDWEYHLSGQPLLKYNEWKAKQEKK